MSDEPTSGPAADKPTELQQLKAALAAGVITPELFATLRDKLEATPPATAAAPPPSPKTTPPPPTEELPSLLDMFSRAPAPVEPPAPLPAPPVVRTPPPPPVASPARPSAAEDAAARQRIEEQLARLRQAPPAATPPAAPPPPAFYPEQPAPTFYPEPKPDPAVMPPAPVAPPRTSAPPPRPPRPGSEPASDGRTSASWLIILLIIGVLGAVAYYFTSSSHPDENLTSPSLPAAESTPAAAPAPTSKKTKKQSRKAKRKAKAARVPVSTAATSDPDAAEEVEETAVATASPTPAPSKAATPPAAGRPIPAVAEAGDNEEDTAVRTAMASYYADLYAPPLHASEHFAPQVERLYIKQNLTPAAIDTELSRSFFPDNQQAQARIEPGTLRVSDPAADGSRTATFTEQMRLYRPSLQKFQRLRTQVRVRFNADYQITYMRQEKLLANMFEE